METSNNYITTMPGQRSLLGAAIAQVRTEMSQMKIELDAARAEVARLKRTLCWRTSYANTYSHTNLRRLRREVALYCHPDRGGDVNVMQRINALFDDLEGTLCAESR